MTNVANTRSQAPVRGTPRPHSSVNPNPKLVPATPRPSPHSNIPVRGGPTHPTGANIRTNNGNNNNGNNNGNNNSNNNGIYTSTKEPSRTYAEIAAPHNSRKRSLSNTNSEGHRKKASKGGSESIAVADQTDNPDGAFVSDSAPPTDPGTPRPVESEGIGAVDGSTPTTVTPPDTAVPMTLLLPVVEHAVVSIVAKCEESLGGMKESIAQFMWGGSDRIKKLQRERDEGLEVLKQLQGTLAHERDMIARLQRKNSQLGAEKQTLATRLDILGSEHEACGGIIDDLRREVAASLEQQSQQLQAAGAEAMDVVLPKIADETIRERWNALVLAIRNFAKQHLAWDYDVALERANGTDAPAGGRDGTGAVGGDLGLQETMCRGLDLILSEESTLTRGDRNEWDRALDRLRRLVLEAHVWRLLDAFIFRNETGLLGGHARGLFSELCEIISSSPCASSNQAIQRFVDWRIHGAVILDQATGIDVSRVSTVASTAISQCLRRFILDSSDRERRAQQLEVIVRGAVELYIIFISSRAVLEVRWPGSWPECCAPSEAGPGAPKEGRVGGGPGEEEKEDDDQTEVLYKCRSGPRFLAVSPALTKRGTADGDRYEEQIVLVPARVVR